MRLTQPDEGKVISGKWNYDDLKPDEFRKQTTSRASQK